MKPPAVAVCSKVHVFLEDIAEDGIRPASIEPLTSNNSVAAISMGEETDGSILHMVVEQAENPEHDLKNQLNLNSDVDNLASSQTCEAIMSLCKMKTKTLDLKARDFGSHVMEYETKTIRNDKLNFYQGFDLPNSNASENPLQNSFTTLEVVNQRDSDLLFLWKMYERLDNKSRKKETLKEIKEMMKRHLHLDNCIDFNGKLVFGSVKGPAILADVKTSNVPLVDNWNCLKVMVQAFEYHCGLLTQYGMKHMRAFANICNNGISKEAMEDACICVCGGYNSEK